MSRTNSFSVVSRCMFGKQQVTQSSTDLGTIETLCDDRAFSDDRRVCATCDEDDQPLRGELVPDVWQTAGDAR